MNAGQADKQTRRHAENSGTRSDRRLRLRESPRAKDQGAPALRPPIREAASGNRSGFTLVEVLAALLLMSIALPAIMHGISVASRAADSARHRTEASLLAASKLNELISTGQYLSQSSGDFGSDWPQMQYTWTLQTADWTPTNNNSNVTPTLQQTMTEVDLTVKWGNFDNDTVTISTLVYPNSPTSSMAIQNAATSASGTTGTTP
jgi:general secretion pathway protein I